MTGDHHGRTARGATLLVRAVDGILGTHKIAWNFAASTSRVTSTAQYHTIDENPGSLQVIFRQALRAKDR
jgi:hypothetical protein